jgi:hypothetical protein
LQYVNILGNLENKMKMEILARFGKDTSNPAEINLSDYASDMESRYGSWECPKADIYVFSAIRYK